VHTRRSRGWCSP